MLDREGTPVRGTGWSVTQWLLGIFGGIATFLGFFVAFGPEDQYIGLGGDWSWQVSEVSDIWMYTLMIGGLAMLTATVWMAVAGRDRIRVPSTPLANLMLHVGVFTAVNAFVWAQDFALGSGLDYALWVTIPWAIGLAAHVAAYLVSDRRETVPIPTEEPAEMRELQHH